MSNSQRNEARTITVDPSLAEVLRLQSLLVLEFNHEPFEDVRDLAPGELLALASVWRDAIAVLDTVGWLPAPRTTTIDVVVTAGHVDQLRRLRDDESTAILDCLDLRDGLTAVDRLADVDADIRGWRLAVRGLDDLLRLYESADTTRR
jgi:hypothetical protein